MQPGCETTIPPRHSPQEAAIKVFIELTQFAGRATARQLRDRIRELEDLGASGVNLWDHIFTSAKSPGGDISRPCDPLVTLGAIAGISDSMELQTTVMNAAWINPSLLLRQFLQLAVFAGGERVNAGLGAGWNTEEFTAIGEKMATFDQRMSRLEESFRIGRELFDTGVANFDGEFVSARDLPMSPLPKVPPRLLTGGGSKRILTIAGRYCDVMDLHGDPKYGAFKGKNLAEKHKTTDRTIASTTVEDTVEQVETVRAASVAAGRPADAVAMSVQLQHLVFCSSASQVRETEERLCRDWGHFDYRPLDQIVATLIGDPHQMAEVIVERQERFGLSRISIKEKDDQDRFLREVLPLLA
jgi:alkanesulfonate monooxygenase SsuD/methylene tetrahydromethanopterin reductase-like flavin-dependent oxidoreductase (luciferase family)